MCEVISKEANDKDEKITEEINLEGFENKPNETVNT